MSYRAAIFLLEGDRVALIERHRQGQHYYTFPGGHVDEGETPEQAAVREAREELGVEVKLGRLVARMSWHGKWQYYYPAQVVSGIFGTGSGEEMMVAHPESGTYQPTWLPVSDLQNHPVLPHEAAELVTKFGKAGWPDEVIVILESTT